MINLYKLWQQNSKNIFLQLFTFSNEPWKENFLGIDFCQTDQNSGNSGKLEPQSK